MGPNAVKRNRITPRVSASGASKPTSRRSTITEVVHEEPANVTYAAAVGSLGSHPVGGEYDDVEVACWGFQLKATCPTSAYARGIYGPKHLKVFSAHHHIQSSEGQITAVIVGSGIGTGANQGPKVARECRIRVDTEALIVFEFLQLFTLQVWLSRSRPSPE
eukprot:scaffold162450_cov23-Prasinocladus_malaysianus.AAC.1